MSASEQPIPAKPRLSWRGVSMLMVSDIVGTSVLTFPAVAAELGYALTVLLIVGLFPVTVYVSVLMARTHVRVRGIDSLGSAARRIFGPRYAGGTFVVVYGYTLLGNASYLLVLGTSLQGVFYDARMCLAAASGLGALLLAPLVVGLRRLGESVVLCFFNLLLVLLCVGVAFRALAAQGRPPCVETHAVAQGVDFTAVFGGATNLVYAYAGQWMYFEMMTEMEAPADFPKAFLLSGPIMVGLYLLVACLGYYYLGGTPAGSLVESVPAGPAYRAAQGLLLLHVTVVYMVKSVVLARSAHGRLAPAADARDARGYARHAALSLAMLFFSYGVTNAVPFFEPLLGLIGGLLSGPINFLLPIALYLGALCRDLGATARESDEAAEASLLRLARLGRAASTRLPLGERIGLALIVAFVLGTMVVGTYSTATSLAARWRELGGPFACHPLVLVNNSDPCGG
mmetsp:Transcript_13222/g.42265  ORF Transcript_13222/g.42265 Transcript_13222/m.42265 type:complete len:456 (+) Transcript_13222:188-1555(+)